MVAAEHYRRKYHGQRISVPSRHELVRKAFFDEGYPDAPDARERICFDLYCINASSPRLMADIENLPDYIMPRPVKTNCLIKNHLVLSFRQLPDLKPNHSCLGAEAWAVDTKRKRIIAVNLPILSIYHIINCASPVSIYYTEEEHAKEYNSLFQFISEEMEEQRHKQPMITDAPRLPYRENLQGIDTSNIDN